MGILILVGFQFQPCSKSELACAGFTLRKQRYEDLLCKQLLRLLANIPPEVTSEIDRIYLKGEVAACDAAGKTPDDRAKGEKAYTFLMDWSQANKDRGVDRSPNSAKLFDQAS